MFEYCKYLMGLTILEHVKKPQYLISFSSRPLQVNPSISSCNCPVDWTDFSGPFQLILWKKMMHVLYTSEFTTHTRTHTQRDTFR